MRLANKRLTVLITKISIYCFALFVFNSQAAPKIERLTWAGVKIVNNNTTVLIDAVGKDLWAGNAPEGLVAVEANTKRRYALITHTHNDHFDVDTLKKVLGEKGYVICSESIATYVASRGLKVIPAKMYTPISRGGFLFTAVPAADGFGSEQVSWVITVGGKRYLHAGDTLWHGNWDIVGQQYGPFEVAFLPINGALVGGEPISEVPAVMAPVQAVDAAIKLGAKQLVPIHYGLNDPPHYVEVKDALKTTRKIGVRRNIKVTPLRPGQILEPD